MRQTRIWVGSIVALAVVAVWSAGACAHSLEVPLQGGTVVIKEGRRDVERGFLPMPVSKALRGISVDVAELVLTVSTEYDRDEPLLIAAFPATVSPGSRTGRWSPAWTSMSGGFDPEFGGLASMLETRESVEITIDVTAMVQRWLSGELPNHGVVLKSLSEDKSTYRWVRDGRYDGAHAKLIVHYSPQD